MWGMGLSEVILPYIHTHTTAPQPLPSIGRITTGSRPSIDRKGLMAAMGPASVSGVGVAGQRSSERPHSTRRGQCSLYIGVGCVVGLDGRSIHPDKKEIYIYNHNNNHLSDKVYTFIYPTKTTTKKAIRTRWLAPATAPSPCPMLTCLARGQGPAPLP